MATKQQGSSSAAPKQTAADAKLSPDVLRNFYFSGAQNFSAFKARATGIAAESSATVSKTTSPSAPAAGSKTSQPGRASTPSGVSGSSPATTVATPAPAAPMNQSYGGSTANRSQVVAAAQAAAANNATAPPAATSTSKAAASKAAAGSAVQAAKAQQTSAAAQSGPSNGDAVSPEYIAFLRHQQDLVKGHQRIAALIEDMSRVAAEQEAEHVESQDANRSLLDTAEQSTNWHWKSKFTKETLQSDAGLTVPEGELRQPDDVPVLTEVVHQHQRLVKLRQDRCVGATNSDHATAFGLVLENGIRRCERVQKEMSQSQQDAAPLIKIADRLIVQLDHVLGIPPLPKVLANITDTIAVLRKKHEECSHIREQAMEDGEMHVAERETYRLADLGEDLASAQIERIQTLRRCSEDIVVSGQVRQEYENTCASDTAVFDGRSNDLKSRCQADLTKLYELKRSVDDLEASMTEKWTADRRASDEKLASIAQEQKESWDAIQALLQKIQTLESQRHNEFKKRVDDKVKDEARRNEFLVFTAVANERAAALDRTIRDCDISLHCSKLQIDFIRSGFAAIERDLLQKKTEVDGLLLDARKEHLAIFRSLLFTLGDIEYKKSKRRDEVRENIQAAHIQQELCSDSLNPNAKKFSDARKELLRVQDDLEVELKELADRQATALSQFEDSERALIDANVDHKHPLDELEERRLATRAKMVEYKAMSLGNVSAAPMIGAEIENLKKSLSATRERVKMARQSTPAAGASSILSVSNVSMQSN